MKIRIKNKLIKIRIKKVSGIGTFTGLMFKTRKTQNLLFEFRRTKKQAIHSFFVFSLFLPFGLTKRTILWKPKL